ncbi:hypothetical protein A8C56_03125 [Niabella ginsenosidivorans]|uniref:MarR family transcriptional regulator n=1 Tax=Niabella ginsenosidivorans TaxID=1176587 RepID=A0A1A9I050_9BACT|nr:DUF488 domain-containing protein [Niabella ginsenosidivorans]ANH80110.1 hypothetical protein A8C56_03125 [Niabella ginsenosidivorans]
MPVINLKRIYDVPARTDGYRVLVDRLWPRGVKKEAADIDEWAKDLAPSDELRKWFHHETAKWKPFQKKYLRELHNNPAAVLFIKAHTRTPTLTLLFAAKDEEHNQAVVLKQFLEAAFSKK